MDKDLSIISGYPDSVIEKVQVLINENRLDQYINLTYPEKHNITSNKALYAYVQDIKKRYMKKSSPIHRVTYDDKIDLVYKALGLHLNVSRVQGRKLKATNEIQISSIFKKAPLDFLEMIVVHELAHLKEKDHDKDFYRLCNHMVYNYTQLEFDLRLYLISLQ